MPAEPYPTATGYPVDPNGNWADQTNIEKFETLKAELEKVKTFCNKLQDVVHTHKHDSQGYVVIPPQRDWTL